MARTIERNIANSWNNICKIYFFSKLHKFHKTFKRNNLKVNSGYTPKKKKKKTEREFKSSQENPDDSSNNSKASGRTSEP